MARKPLLWLCLAALLLSACGGGRETSVPTQPAAATTAPTPSTDVSSTQKHDQQKTKKPEVKKMTPPVSLVPPPPSRYEPRVGDDQLERRQAYIHQASVRVTASTPPAYALELAGDLPTACHELRVLVREPDEQMQIQIESYSVVDANQVCAQALAPFQVEIALGSFPSGQYSVWLNGERVGEILVP